MNSPRGTSRIKADTIVIGAGPARLGAALALGDSAIVLEKREAAGGPCGTVTLDGAIFDLGGHSFHTASRHPSACIRRLGNGGAEPRRVVLAEWGMGTLSVPAAF
jgi:protoporphyrinogen oxidase